MDSRGKGQAYLVAALPDTREHDLRGVATCGDGALVTPLRAAGFKVIASDIVDRGCPDSHVQDFLAPAFGTKTEAQRRRVAGFTNPPFNRACEFIVKGCEHYDYLARIF